MAATRFDPREKGTDWTLAKLAKAQRERKPTTIMSPQKADATQDTKEMSEAITGLYFWHFYAVIGVDEEARRVKLFNPWGRDHPGEDGWVDIDVIKTFFKEVAINE